MVNIVIYDDNKNFCNDISRMLKERILYDKKILVFNKYDEVLAKYVEKNTKNTIFILDIDLKDRKIEQAVTTDALQNIMIAKLAVI
jgi:hypothetical protein